MAQNYDFYYKEFFALNRDLFCVMSETGYFLQVNESWEKVLGYSEEEMLSQPFYYFMHPDDVAATVEVASKTAAGTESRATFINRYRAKNGSYHYFDWCGYVEEGLFYGFARDISALKNQEIEIKRLKKRMQAIIDWQNNYVFGFDLSGNYIYANHKYLDSFSSTFATRDLIGQPIAKAISPNYQATFSAAVSQAIQNPNTFFTLQIEKLIANDTVSFSDWDIICIADENEQPLELQCVAKANI